MYMKSLCMESGCSDCRSGLSGLGSSDTDDAAAIAARAAMAYYTGGASEMMGSASGSGQGGSGMPASAASSTNVYTNVSPTISPNFIQQQQPTNSAVNATTQNTPADGGMGMPGLPGMPSPVFPSYAAQPSYYASAPSQGMFGLSNHDLMLAAGGVILMLLLSGRRHVS